jgi:CBS domain-containing protein
VADNIRQVMSNDPVTISVDAPVEEAARSMRASDIGGVIVLDESDNICGIVTDRDIAVRVVAEGRDPSQTSVGDVCSKDPVTISPDTSIGEAVKLMSDKAIRRIPVVENGRPVGLVALGDLTVARDPESALADISAAPPNE